MPQRPELFGVEEDVDAGAGASKKQSWGDSTEAEVLHSSGSLGAEHKEVKLDEHDPLNIKSEHVRQLVQNRISQLLRPLRLLPVGRNVNMTPADKDFVSLALDTDMPIC